MVKYLQYVYLITACFFAATIHEYIKALTSAKQGDPTPKKRNKLTLDPRVHFEPIGMICMVVSGGYGWGNPVETSSLYYKDRHKNTLVTYIMPSLINLFIGMIFALLSNIFLYVLKNAQDISTLIINLHICLSIFASVNIKLALFNIIPVYPLDGSKVLSEFISRESLVKYENYEKILQILLMFLLLSGLVDSALGPIANAFMSFSKIIS